MSLLKSLLTFSLYFNSFVVPFHNLLLLLTYVLASAETQLKTCILRKRVYDPLNKHQTSLHFFLNFTYEFFVVQRQKAIKF